MPSEISSRFSRKLAFIAVRLPIISAPLNTRESESRTPPIPTEACILTLFIMQTATPGWNVMPT